MKITTLGIIGLSVLTAGTSLAQNQRRQANPAGGNPRQYDTTTMRQPGATRSVGTTSRAFNSQGGAAPGYELVIVGTSRFYIRTNSIYGTNRFEEIELNNIFDPTRRPVLPPPTNAPPSYSFALSGAVTWENKAYAILSGSGVSSRSDYTNGATINGFTISDITLKSVKLTSPSNEVFTLERGQRLSRTEGQPWQLTGMAESVAESMLRSAVPINSSGEIDPGYVDDITKRLMERRAKESGGGAATEGGSTDSGEMSAPAEPSSPPDLAPILDGLSTEPSGPADEVTRRLMQRRMQESGGAAANDGGDNSAPITP